MHTYISKTATFIFDGDMQGDLIIRDKEDGEVRIDAKDVLRLVAYNYVLPSKISALEDMKYNELLKWIT